MSVAFIFGSPAAEDSMRGILQGANARARGLRCMREGTAGGVMGRYGDLSALKSSGPRYEMSIWPD